MKIYYYAPLIRPIGPGCQPEDFIRHNYLYSNSKGRPYGIVGYAGKLSDEEIEKYTMEFVEVDDD